MNTGTSSVKTSSTCRVGIDIGGTFTDIVVLKRDGTLLVKKVSSTPADYGVAISQGVSSLLKEHSISPEDVEEVVHATTVATNAVLESKGAKTALVTTEGFRDVLEFRRVRVPELYKLDYIKPKPLVPRRLRLEVRERVGAGGAVRIPLDEESVLRVAQRLKEEKVEAVAVCLLHAYANPVHEVRISEIFKDVLPSEVFVCYSHQVLPEIREYERTSTTVVNSYLGPVLRRYLSGLRDRLAEIGIRRSFHVMQSGGGRMSLEAAIAKPAYLVESGPAAGVIAAAHIAKKAGFPSVITLDVGGTTAKTAMVEDGEPTRTGEYEVGAGINLSSKLVKGAGYAIKLPFIDVSEIGAGGGSHIRFDKGGLLKVGPESAASVPGPVCYGRGGEIATLTDAVLALGYLNPTALVGGELQLDFEKSVRALEDQVGKVLGCSLFEAAYGVYSVAVANMVRAVKSVSTYRGRDPRDYALIAFGGNGPVLAPAIAHELGICRVLIPANPGVLSSYGLLVADNTHEMVRSISASIYDLDVVDLEREYQALASRAIEALADDGFDRERITVRRLADLRYVGQAFELTVPLDDAPLNRETLTALFHEEHYRTYAHKSPGEPVELVNIRVIATVSAYQSDLLRQFSQAASEKDLQWRKAYFGPDVGEILTPVVGRAYVGKEQRRGPLILEEYDSTVVVPPGWMVDLDVDGNLVLTAEMRNEAAR